MVTLLLRLLRLLPLLCGAHRHVALENLALRHQLAVYKKTVTRPKVRRSDRLFWVALSRGWAGWRQALVIVSPNTVLRWQRRRFCEHWTKLSARPIAGRRPVNAEIKALVTRDGCGQSVVGRPENSRGTSPVGDRRLRAHRLSAHAEAAPPAVSGLADVPRQPCPRSGRPRFLHGANRAPARPLCSRRARSPPPARRPLQRDRAPHRPRDRPADRGRLPNDSAPSYLLRDRDLVYGEQFRHRVKGMRIEEVLTAPHSPWQNPFAERLIGSIRRECLNHVLVLGESHLRRILARYFSYYHRARTHLALDKDAPDVRPIKPPGPGHDHLDSRSRW